MLIDSDIFIWHLRGNTKAERLIKTCVNPCMSAVTYMEVVRGILNKESLRNWKIFLQNFDIKIIMITPEISAYAMHLCDQYSLSHSLIVSDALIAATADRMDITLATCNIKDFKFITNLTIKPFKA